jgi:hypothetical protein
MKLTLLLLLLAVCLTLWFIVKLQPSSAGAFGFAVVWLNIPYAVMAMLLFVLRRRGSALLPWCIAVVLVVAAGLGMFLDAIYWHPDPQSAIAVVVTPLVQGFIFLIGAPLAWWVGRRLTNKD